MNAEFVSWPAQIGWKFSWKKVSAGLFCISKLCNKSRRSIQRGDDFPKGMCLHLPTEFLTFRCADGNCTNLHLKLWHFWSKTFTCCTNVCVLYWLSTESLSCLENSFISHSCGSLFRQPLDCTTFGAERMQKLPQWGEHLRKMSIIFITKYNVWLVRRHASRNKENGYKWVSKFKRNTFDLYKEKSSWSLVVRRLWMMKHLHSFCYMKWSHSCRRCWEDPRLACEMLYHVPVTYAPKLTVTWLWEDRNKKTCII